MNESLGLRSIDGLKIKYDSDYDDIVRDFYIPVLSKSTHYRRLAGFFSSTALALAARGIRHLIKNGGKMQLVVGAKLRASDVEAIKSGILDREQAIRTSFLAELEQISDGFFKNHVRALAWMVSRGILEIKIATIIDEEGSPIDYEALKTRGIYHMKVGIFEDGTDRISFSGSVNESATGWRYSVEEFKVFRSWVSGHSDFLNEDIKTFERYWNNSANRTVVSDLPTAIRDDLIKYAPDNLDELDLDYDEKPRPLWKNQIEALEAWKKNDYKGILAMATASGKTLTALEASSLASKSVITLVLVPTIPLLKQWNTEIHNFDHNAQIITCGGKGSNWKEILPSYLASVRSEDYSGSESDKRLYVVSTLDTASDDGFILTWKGVPPDKVQIIADEVHHLGAPTYQRCMQIPSLRRIGLSATPDRQWDDEGTRAITDYFGPTIYEYTIKEGIHDGRLCHYEYYPYFAYLNEIEFEDFSIKTAEINAELARLHGKNKEKTKDAPSSPRLKTLLNQRAIIKKKAVDKVRAFENICSQTSERPLLIFCEDHEQMDDLISVLNKKNISYGIYTSQQKDEQKDIVLQQFRRKDTDMLMAINCLDEGLDVPNCPACIIVASSTSTREFVQRRGRVLRIAGKDKIAKMYDIITLPTNIKNPQELEIARKLITPELERVSQLVEAADNEWEVRTMIKKELSKYSLESLAYI